MMAENLDEFEPLHCLTCDYTAKKEDLLILADRCPQNGCDGIMGRRLMPGYGYTLEST